MNRKSYSICFCRAYASSLHVVWKIYFQFRHCKWVTPLFTFILLLNDLEADLRIFKWGWCIDFVEFLNIYILHVYILYNSLTIFWSVWETQVWVLLKPIKPHRYFDLLRFFGGVYQYKGMICKYTFYAECIPR